MALDLLIVIIGIILLIVGLIGCILPIVPGPLIAWLSLPLLLLTSDGYADFDKTWFIIITVLMIVVTIIDFLLPIWGNKLTGGTNAGKIGSALGLVIGLIFLGPFGIIIGPFLGALIGELTINNDFHFAIKSSFGTLIGFLLGTVLKITVVILTVYEFIDCLV